MSVKIKPLNHMVPKEHLACIGDMTVSFSMLEQNIIFVIMSLLGGSQRVSQIITAELSFKQLCSLAINLYDENYGRNNDAFKGLKSLIGKARVIEDRRNQITHSFWGHGGDSPIRFKVTAKQKVGLNFQQEIVSIDDLKIFLEEIKTTSSEILAFAINFSLKSMIANSQN